MQIHRSLAPLNRALCIDTNPVPVKDAFEILGVSVGRPRLPLVPLDRAKREELKNVLRNYEDDFRGGWSSSANSVGE